MTAMNFDWNIGRNPAYKERQPCRCRKRRRNRSPVRTGLFYEELLGLKFKITPFSFFQTNSLGAEVLYETAREYIGDTNEKVVFDLYSGTGTIAQILAPVAKKVVGVEIVEEAVEAAKENAKLNNLDNCTFWAGDVLKVIDELGGSSGSDHARSTERRCESEGTYEDPEFRSGTSGIYCM